MIKKKIIILAILILSSGIAGSLFYFTNNTESIQDSQANGKDQLEIFMSRDDLIVWDENRPLTWDDFWGEPPDIDEFGAEVNVGVQQYLNVNTSHSSDFCEYAVDDVYVFALLDKKFSWAKEGGTDYHLKHEQVHFDIQEINARTMEKKLNEELLEKKFPCPVKDGKFKDKWNNIESHEKADAIVKEIIQKFEKMADDYETETDHSLIFERQIWWNDEIERLLEETKNFRD